MKIMFGFHNKFQITGINTLLTLQMKSSLLIQTLVVILKNLSVIQPGKGEDPFHFEVPIFPGSFPASVV